RQHTIGVVSSCNSIDVADWAHDTPAEHVDLQSHMTGQAGGFPSNPAIAPEADCGTAQFALKLSGTVPDRRVLIADELPEIADKVDHHRDIPFGNRRVEAAAGICRPNSTGGQIKAK